MCKAKRMTRAELDNKIVDHAKRCKKYKPNAAIREHVASMNYERFMRERQAEMAREADARMKEIKKWPMKKLLSGIVRANR